MMQRLFCATTVLWLSLSSSFAYDLQHVLSSMEERERSVNSVKFTFQQDIEFKDAGLKEYVDGEASFKKEKKMLISKNSPQKQVTISNGNKVWIYTPAYKQVWVGTPHSWKGKNNMPDGFFSVDNLVAELKKNFTLTLEPSGEEKAVVLKALPKSPLGYELTFFISSESWFPNKTIYTSDSARVETVFANLEENVMLSDSIFNFQPPKGTDIISLN